MCGRFALSVKTKDIEKLLPGLDAGLDAPPRYNIAPMQNIAAILNNDIARLAAPRWGLVPFWAKDESIAARLINARAESLAEKPAFKYAFAKRRCLIPSNGFYEWKAAAGSKIKTPYYISLKNGQAFTMAGLWESWNKSGSNLLTAVIITTSPNELIGPIHDRMPCIVPESLRGLWLSGQVDDLSTLGACLASYPAGEMQAWQVSTKVNNPAYDAPDCIDAAV